MVYYTCIYLTDDCLVNEPLDWKTIKPQLEDTIKLRREHTAVKFHNHRRLERQNEMKERFSKFRPQLEGLSRHKLFHNADFLKLPAVEELVEENECRIPVSDDRWLVVRNTLVDAVRDHAKRIQDDCNQVIEDAKTEAGRCSEGTMGRRTVRRMERTSKGKRSGEGRVGIRRVRR